MEMKNLQIVIDLKDLYTEYNYDGESDNGDLNEVLKTEIQSQVLNKMITGFSPEIVRCLKEEMIKKFNDQFGEKVSERIIRVIEHGIFSEKKGTFNINDYVKQRFELATTAYNFQSNLDKVIKQRVKEMETSLQARYDLEFASMIIKKLKDGNLLKEGAEKMLIKD